MKGDECGGVWVVMGEWGGAGWAGVCLRGSLIFNFVIFFKKDYNNMRA